MKTLTTFLGLAVLSGALVGCNSGKQNENALLDENRSLRDRLGQTQSDLQAAEDENRRLSFQLEENKQVTANMNAQPPQVISNFGPGVEVFQRDNETVVRIEGDVLFDSGRDTLKSSAKNTLAKVAKDIEAQYPNANVRVTGYTDSDPIKKSGHQSNYHLGFTRAFAVGQYLGSQGIRKSKLSYATYGPQDPLGSKAKSRRVEVTVMTED